MGASCAAVDWGTSSFRLWLLGEDGEPLAERRSDEGMLHAVKAGFPVILESHLRAIGADAALPVVICGMAGARQGWREAAYLSTPARLQDIPRQAQVIPGHPRDVRILPGIAQREQHAPDVMRGEETQLLGLASAGARSGHICMPGTHSKWVKLSTGTVSGFSTYMTGELFATLSGHSILAMAMDADRDVAPNQPAFIEAGKAAFARPEQAANLLFQIRAGQLLGFSHQFEGAARLSGLLIGLELAGASALYRPMNRVTLLSSGPLGALYGEMLRALGISLDVEDAEIAVRRGLWSAAQLLWAGREG